MKQQMLENAINMAISGYLFREGEIEEVPNILNKMAKDYTEQIEIQKESLQIE